MRIARLAHKPQQGAAAAGSYLKDIGFTLVSENGKALHAACLACSEGGEQQQKEGQHIGHGHPLTRFYSVLRGALKRSFAGRRRQRAHKFNFPDFQTTPCHRHNATPGFEPKCGSVLELYFQVFRGVRSRTVASRYLPLCQCARHLASHPIAALQLSTLSRTWQHMA